MNDKFRKELIKTRLNDEIKASKMSYAEIARLVGCTKSMISQYKTTNKMPTILMLAKICEVIGADANYILGISE